VLDFCRKNFPKDWRKAFEEDLVEVLSKMKKPPENGTLKVKVRPIEGGEEKTFEAVWLNEANVESVIKNRQVIVAGAGGAVAVPAAGAQAKRLERAHAPGVAERFKSLTERIEPRSAAGKDVLTPKQVGEDLDELEWHLVNRYASLARHTLDYKAAFDTVRAGVDEKGVARGAFALQLHRLLALFADGDTGAMLDPEADLPEGYLPFLVAEVAGGKVVAYDPGGAGLVDLDRPVLAKLDGVEIEKWLDAAKAIAPGGSPQSVRRQCVADLRYVNFLRDRLKLPRKDAVSVELSSPDGNNGHAIEIKLAMEPVKPPLPREGLRRTLEGNVGYLRLASANDDVNFLKALHDAMAESRATDGLVIDLRRGGGAGPGTPRELFPYFMDATEKPLVAAVAAYRLSAERGEQPDAREGFLQDRRMFPITAAAWTDAERDAIAKFARDFEPEWKPPAPDFSAWHCLVLSPRQGGPYYRYDKPVAVLADAGSSGAADVLLAAFKGRKGVTLVGTPSAGATGRSEAVRLANSGVAVRASTTTTFRPDGKSYDGRGVEPDVLAWPEPNDFIGRTDSVLETARKRVLQK
jgi:ribosomal protein L12E/L44/L45/RPP1/RPP2